MISIPRARTIARRLTAKFPGRYTALEAFAATACVDPGFLRAIRDAEANIAQWQATGQIDSDLYWGVVDLGRFSNDHFDDLFARLKQYHKNVVRKSTRMRQSSDVDM